MRCCRRAVARPSNVTQAVSRPKPHLLALSISCGVPREQTTVPVVGCTMHRGGGGVNQTVSRPAALSLAQTLG
jgi:hypothetical protein